MLLGDTENENIYNQKEYVGKRENVSKERSETDRNIIFCGVIVKIITVNKIIHTKIESHYKANYLKICK